MPRKKKSQSRPAIPDALTDPDRTVALWRQLGYSLFLSLQWEELLIRFFSVVLGVQDYQAERELDSLLGRTHSWSGNALLKRVRSKVALSAGTSELFKRYFREREWLVFRLLRDEGESLHGSPDAYMKLLQRVRDVGNMAVRLQAEFGALLGDWDARRSVAPTN